MKEFLASLQNYHSEISFNPWADYDTSCDIGPRHRRFVWKICTDI